MLQIQVEVYQSIYAYEEGDAPIRAYKMNHDNPDERRVLGQQCRNAFEGGNVVITYPHNYDYTK